MKIQTYKKLLSMVQKIKGMCWTAICLLALGIMVAPCFLAFSQGADGELTWMNVVGVAWIGVLFFGVQVQVTIEARRNRKVG